MRRAIDSRIEDWADSNLNDRIETALSDDASIITTANFEDKFDEMLGDKNLLTENETIDKIDEILDDRGILAARSTASSRTARRAATLATSSAMR